jgi:PAS domain-containing protein
MHKLLAKQLVRATDAAGTLDVAALSELVSAAYDETDRDRRRTERSIALMVEELDQLSSRDREQLHAQLELQSQRFEAAVENMTQGLCMFDGEHKLITCNKRWMELFSVSEHLGKPGTQYRDILGERVASGHFPGRTFDEVLAERLAIHRSRTPRVFEQRLRDGRIVITFHQPLDQGGWVSTFEDVTEVRTQNLRFEAAVENMTQGLCMFDAEQKLIICNKRWLDLFGIPRALGQPGTAFRAVLEARLANGTMPAEQSTTSSPSGPRCAGKQSRRPSSSISATDA